MDEQVIRKIQREGAEALLDAGVSLPLKDLRIPFRKEPLRSNCTLVELKYRRRSLIRHYLRF